MHLKNWTKFYSSFISSHCDKHVSNVSIFQNQGNYALQQKCFGVLPSCFIYTSIFLGNCSQYAQQERKRMFGGRGGNLNKLRNTTQALKKKKRVSTVKLFFPLSYIQLIARSHCLVWISGLISIQDQCAIPTQKFQVFLHQKGFQTL